MNVIIKIAKVNTREELKAELSELIHRIDSTQLPVSHAVGIFKEEKYSLEFNAEPLIMRKS